MQLIQLAKAIHALRNTDSHSQIILHGDAGQNSPEPIGVLLLKPSSGYLPLKTINEILERLVFKHGYRIVSVTWWNGQSMRDHAMMSLHYPGFHRVAHGGWETLSPEALGTLQALYANPSAGFSSAFKAAFDRAMVRRPYDLVEKGILPERLNQVWEIDRTKEPSPAKRVQRLDDDSFCLAVELTPENFGNQTTATGTVVLLNGFYAKLEKDFEAKGCVALLIKKEPDSGTSWETLRSEYAGKTNPFQAPLNTIRGDAARGVLQVETVSLLANVIHLSANEAEGRREAEQVWWEPARFKLVFGAGAGP